MRGDMPDVAAAVGKRCKGAGGAAIAVWFRNGFTLCAFLGTGSTHCSSRKCTQSFPASAEWFQTCLGVPSTATSSAWTGALIGALRIAALNQRLPGATIRWIRNADRKEPSANPSGRRFSFAGWSLVQSVVVAPFLPGKFRNAGVVQRTRAQSWRGAKASTHKLRLPAPPDRRARREWALHLVLHLWGSHLGPSWSSGWWSATPA